MLIIRYLYFCHVLSVWIEKIMKNETTNTVVFYSKTYSCFKVKNNYQKPTSEFYFTLIEKATYEFAKQFHQRTQNTNISHHKIQKPSFLQFKEKGHKGKPGILIFQIDDKFPLRQIRC